MHRVSGAGGSLEAPAAAQEQEQAEAKKRAQLKAAFEEDRKERVRQMGQEDSYSTKDFHAKLETRRRALGFTYRPFPSLGR